MPIRRKAASAIHRVHPYSAAAQGGRERVDTASLWTGRKLAKAEIVIYAPQRAMVGAALARSSLIPIKADSTWSTETQSRIEYAALLVERIIIVATTDAAFRPQGGSVARDNCGRALGAPQLAPTGIA